ncbi:phage tail protein, partial [Chromobacterium vaccinii]|uniref:phage tail protein n=1 Tax=Chromobacterium vaccinii TaxID=1108595 RepID=UPI0032618C18
AGHVDALRAIGDALEPVTLTTGYGEHLGRWYLTRVQEEQSHLFADGAPRKQSFSLEFTRYGEDYRNV